MAIGAFEKDLHIVRDFIVDARRDFRALAWRGQREILIEGHDAVAPARLEQAAPVDAIVVLKGRAVRAELKAAQCTEHHHRWLLLASITGQKNRVRNELVAPCPQRGPAERTAANRQREFALERPRSG